MIRFHGYFRSSSSYRCRIACNLKGLRYDFVSVHLVQGGQKTEAFKALNPQALIPAFELEGGEVLTQSPAILEWMNETYPEPALLPNDPVERAHVRAFCAAIACEIHPLQNLRILKYLRNEFGQDQSGVEAWCQRWIGEGLAACEAFLSKRTPRDFCFGDTPGMADIYLVPQVFSAERFKVDLRAMPNVQRVAKACESVAAFAEAHPARQSDAE